MSFSRVGCYRVISTAPATAVGRACYVKTKSLCVGRSLAGRPLPSMGLEVLLEDTLEGLDVSEGVRRQRYPGLLAVDGAIPAARCFAVDVPGLEDRGLDGDLEARCDEDGTRLGLGDDVLRLEEGEVAFGPTVGEV